MTDATLDRQLAHAYIEKLPPDQLAAVRELLERMLDIRMQPSGGEKPAAATEEILGDFGLTLSEVERMSHN
jgi:hypothetical protein